MAKAVQSHSTSPSSEHETARSRNSIKKWYIIWGLDSGTQIVPKNWLVESVTPSAKTTKGERKFGYHWYIPYDAEDGIFFTMGIYGQFLFIDQNRHVVIVVTAADPDWREPNILHNTQEILKTIAKTV